MCLTGSAGCEALWSSHPPECGRQCDERVAWKRDVALEISVDVNETRATTRLGGTLTDETAMNVAALVDELIREGREDFELETFALCVPDEGAVRGLNMLQRLIHKSGGYLSWDGLTLNHPFPARNGRRGRKADTAWCAQVAAFDDHRHPVVRLPQSELHPQDENVRKE